MDRIAYSNPDCVVMVFKEKIYPGWYAVGTARPDVIISLRGDPPAYDPSVPMTSDNSWTQTNGETKAEAASRILQEFGLLDFDAAMARATHRIQELEIEKAELKKRISMMEAEMSNMEDKLERIQGIMEE